MPDDFSYDVFLSHSAKDKPIVRDIAERLKNDGLKVWFDEWVLKPGDSIPAKIEEGLERSRVLVLCMSAHAFGSDWAQLESGTFRFRDPLNKERRFLPLRLDDAPIKGSLAQLLYIDWRDEAIQSFPKLLEACLPLERTTEEGASSASVISLAHTARVLSVAIGADGRLALSSSDDKTLRLWNAKSGQCWRVLERNADRVWSVALSADSRLALSGSTDKMLRLWDVKNGQLLGFLRGHTARIRCVAFNIDGSLALSGSDDYTLRLWQGINCLRVFTGHANRIYSVAFSADSRRAVSGAADNTLRLWEVDSGKCLLVLKGHRAWVRSVALSLDGRNSISGSDDNTVRLWDLETGRCLRVFEGHSARVRSVALSADGRFALSGSDDKTLRFWDVNSGECVSVFTGHTGRVWVVGFNADSHRAFSGSEDNEVRVWDLPEYVADTAPKTDAPRTKSTPGQVQYTNAKVLLVGDTHAGKTGLTYRLATSKWKPSEDSTVGAWSTQLKLEQSNVDPGVDREIWLWDFGGQADQRLIHQLYMDRTALILLLFNADQEDVLPGLRDWQTALRRSLKTQIPHFLVAGRIDTGFKASRGKLQTFAQEQGLAYYETSAKSGDGCDELRTAVIDGIPWEQMEKRTSPRIFKLIKDEILKLRDEGQVLHTFKELRELLWRRLPDEPRFTDEILQTVIGLLDGPGVVKELEYGTYILLAPEWINAYAQAVIRTLRSAENDLGVLPLRSIAEGKLIYQSIGRDGVPVEMKRLPPAEERVVLGEMERQLEQRGLCLRQGDKLVFPSHCGRDRPAVLEHPSVFVSYVVKGFLDDIYATLVVKLADSESFQLKELWREAADFVTLRGDFHMGIKLTRESASDGDISVYFGKGVTDGEQVIFANYIHTHLMSSSETVKRLRQYVCPNCNTPKGNPEVLMDKLGSKGKTADTECDKCGERFPLWDALEKKFADPELGMRSGMLNVFHANRLDSRRKGKLLALEVAARISSADQKCFEIPATEDEGIDMELEFTDDEGKGTGQRLYLQLKSGNGHLRTRKTDGAEIFVIKEQRWVKYWLAQKEPVMLVIGNFDRDVEYAENKLEFIDVRWMEISSVLKLESKEGKKQVKQIEFKGERMDMASVRRWREKVLGTPAKA